MLTSKACAARRQNTSAPSRAIVSDKDSMLTASKKRSKPSVNSTRQPDVDVDER